LTSLLVSSCGGASDPTATESAEKQDTAPVTDAASDERITLDTAGKDYGGDTFHIVNYDNVTDNQWVGIPDDIFCEEESGDVLGDAVYQRNRTVEEALNIKITSEKMAATVMPDSIRRSVMAGNTDYDAVFPSMQLLPQFREWVARSSRHM
jgi:hypothetical protein